MSKLRLTAVFIALTFSFTVFSQAAPQLTARQFRPVMDDTFADDTPVKKVAPKLVNLTEFLVPDLKYSDPLQYHFTGYGRCFRNTSDCRDESGVPILREGGFCKIARTTDSPEGDVRFIFQKGATKPNEYYIVKNEPDSDGKPVQVVYLETETMDWTGNQVARDYHADDGSPTFEWGRSNALLQGFNPQNWIRATWTFCGAKPNEYDFQGPTPHGYVPRVYDLSKDHEAINRDLAELGPIEPKWLDMARDTGKDPQLLVYAGYWSPVREGVSGNDPTLWRYRELYYYIKGLGFVGWRWQEHVDGDRFKPFQTLQEGLQNAVVWEDEPILPLAVCEKVPQ